jgi:hypothetical protein
MLKNRLRWFIVWSSRPPLLAVYRGIYWLVIRFATFVLRRYRSILALYLCRGCAKKDITPGISDIDFIIFVTDDSQEIAAIRNFCRVLEKVTGGMVDYYPNLVTPLETLNYRWSASPTWQYGYHEGRTTWQLLHGTNVLTALSPLTEAQRRSSCYADMNRWWMVFAQYMFATKEDQQDRIMQNVACYKAVSELLNLQRALQTGQYRYSREKSLEETDLPLAKRLAELAARRFLPYDDQLLEETFTFLITFFIELWSGFEDCPFLAIYQEGPQYFDCPASELHVGEKERQHLSLLQQHLDTHWGPKCTGTHLVKSAFWDFDDLLWIMDADLNRLPTLQEVADLTTLHHLTRRELSQDIYLFLRLESVAFPLIAVLPRDLQRGLVTRATVPDVFLQLGHDKVYWTNYTQWYLTEWQRTLRWPDRSAQKQQQLNLILQSVENGSIVYRLTPQALEREAQNLNHPLR